MKTIFVAISVLFLSKPPIVQGCPSDIRADSIAFTVALNDFRQANGKSRLSVSVSLMYVAQKHVENQVIGGVPSDPCNLHSWNSIAGEDYRSCCYTSDHAQAQCMWDKPREITSDWPSGGCSQFTGSGYEISGNNYADIGAAITGWNKSEGHRKVMLTLENWGDLASVGCAFQHPFYHCWFGKIEDPNSLDQVLDILTPSFPTHVGPPGSPGRFLLTVRVSNQGTGASVSGLAPSDFTVRVGNREAQVVSHQFAYVGGEYWMIVQAPVQDASVAGERLDLGVESGALSDSRAMVIQYGDRVISDNVVTIDTSGSMNSFGKIDAAKVAAQLYTDSLQDGDKLGVIRYNQEAIPIVPLNDWATVQQTAKDQIDDLVASGLTSLGTALLEALDQLKMTGVFSHEWAIILLSDGINTVGLDIPAFLSAYDAREGSGCTADTSAGCQPVVHVAAVGPDANRLDLLELAEKTGGRYHFAQEPSGRRNLRNRALQQFSNCSDDLQTDLIEIYRVINEDVSNSHQIYSERGLLPDFGDDPVEHKIAVDGSATEAVFVFASPITSGLRVSIQDEDEDSSYPPDVQDGGYYIWRIDSPNPGTWTMRVSRANITVKNRGTQAAEGCYLVEASVFSDLRLVTAANVEKPGLPGAPAQLLAFFSESGLTDQWVRASIVDPDGAVDDVMFLDDGLHGDGEAGDGLFGYTLQSTPLSGSYRVFYEASATSTIYGSFVRTGRDAFVIGENPFGFEKLLINGGSPTTESLEATLTIEAVGAMQMKISNSATFDSAPWLDYRQDVTGWKLEPENNVATVCVLLRSGTVRQQQCASIFTVPTCSNAFAETVQSSTTTFQEVTIGGVVDPSGGGPVQIVVTDISQDEPVAGSGPDAMGVGSPTAKLRAESNGDGRVYHVSFTATSSQVTLGPFGGFCTGTVSVCIPRKSTKSSKRTKKPGSKSKSSSGAGCIDQGPLYDSLGIFNPPNPLVS